MVTHYVIRSKHKESSLGKALFSLFIVSLLLFSPVFASPPPANGNYHAGWGMNPNNWQTATGQFGPVFGIWQPGHDWVVGYDGCYNPIYIDYDNITLDLWIELYCLQTYEFTHYQWHRIGNADETINFYICGWISSNNGECVSLMRGNEDLDHLYFREDIFGRTNRGRDIPITWHYAWGSYDRPGGESPPEPGNIGCWHEIVPNDHGNLTFCIPDPCDHWFCFWGQFRIRYHENDGHYQLVMAGCPAPLL